jgi:hypothetical protein
MRPPQVDRSQLPVLRYHLASVVTAQAARSRSGYDATSPVRA